MTTPADPTPNRVLFGARIKPATKKAIGRIAKGLDPRRPNVSRALDFVVELAVASLRNEKARPPVSTPTPGQHTGMASQPRRRKPAR